MCGINGILRLSASAPPVDRAELVRTRDAMAARGPDGAGEWIDDDASVGLGSRRLAILDLSQAGAQPMVSADGRYHIVHNGEIYNFRELRAELLAAGATLRSESDTEVLVELYARHGTAMLPRLSGMFAFAIWDEHARTLLLARDPYGIKPLYYAATGGTLRFASQVKALLASEALTSAIDPAGVAGFLLWGSVPEPRTLYRAIRQLPAGHALLIDGGEVRGPHPFKAPAPDDSAPAADVPAAALLDSVRDHLVSDVPVAVFLSAGLDSALIAALGRRLLPEPPTTFTLTFDGFRGTRDDEGPLAAEVARALGTRHVERKIGPDELAALWPQALQAMDQPSADGFNTFLVSRIAAEAGFKVALSGLGGDELFGSYPSFHDVPRWAHAAAWGRRLGLTRSWPALAHRVAPGRPKLTGLLRYGRGLAGAYFLRRGLFLPEELPGLLGPELAEEGLHAYDAVADAKRALAGPAARGADPWTAVHRMESALYLRNQLLRDADWASMACSLELRVPLVDARLCHRLAAIAFEPAKSRGKGALVRRVASELPAPLFRRPKSGFRVPLPIPSTGRSLGAGSRALALYVLESFGVTLHSHAT